MLLYLHTFGELVELFSLLGVLLYLHTFGELAELFGLLGGLCYCTCTHLVSLRSCSVCLEAISSSFLYASSGDVCRVITASMNSYRYCQGDDE